MQTAVATCDSLSVFMREMEKHPVLSKEEEYALAVKYYENEDLEAANKLVVSNLRFVVRIASEYKSYGFPMMDLVQEGSIGLMRAVKKFNPYRGYRLISYAVWWIRVRIQNHIMKFWSNVKIGTTQSQRKLFQRIEGAKRKLGITAASMEDDDISRLADHFGVKEEEISEMHVRASKRDLSLSERPAGDDSSVTYAELLPDPSDNQEQVLGELGFDSLARENLREALETLSARQKKVINERYFTEPPRKLHEIAQDLGVSQERVRQIQAESIGKLRGYMAERLETHP
ncbi:MAG: RNA polymerase factor sigma-32 [Candidatus Dadabacteria bacterium]|nr:RNA polymerase factor sigma-32 [Candidatus Dadabacteria bacterium]